MITLESKADPDEKCLTNLVSALSVYLQELEPSFFTFENKCLRGAFERYIYFDVMAGRRQSLYSLMNLTKAWRDTVQDIALIETYDYFWSQQQKRSVLQKCRAPMLSWGRFAKSMYQSLAHPLFYRRRKTTDISASNPHGFFVTYPRFISFFRPITDVLKESRSRVCYFSESPHALLGHTQNQQSIAWLKNQIWTLRKPSFLPITNLLLPDYLRICSFYFQIYEALKHYKPQTLIFAEGTSHYDELASQAAKALGIKTVRIQSGRAGILHSGYRDMSFDVMLCWSEDFVQRYRAVSPEATYKVVGSPLIDEFVKLKQKNTDEQKCVLIITQPVSKHLTTSDYLQLISVAKKLLDNCEHAEIVVRRHPADKHNGFLILAEQYVGRISLMEEPKHSLADAFSHSICALGFFSTALSEAAACDVIPVILQTRESQSVYPFPEKHNAAILTKNADEAVGCLNHIVTQPEDFVATRQSMRAFSIRFFGPSDGNSLLRIMSELQ
ncbi:hypothetical protein [Methylophaga sp.]|uniref:hypothetical protein n=1 Tax=Methylophaga sp. TaxID=2024840 RepID=UPI0025E65345|nr:hypothetical protein [Methylophaga sp.]